MRLKVFLIGIVVLMGLWRGTAGAQDTLSFPFVEEKTWQYYTEQKWDSLISIGKKALKAEIDYFYLRLRLGAAYYESGKTALSIPHFEKALDFNSGSTLTYEYYYYALLRMNRLEEARSFSRKFSKPLKEKTGETDPLKLSFIYFEGGLGFKNDIEDNKIYFDDKPEVVFGEINLVGNTWYFHTGFKLFPGRRFSIYNGYSGTQTQYGRMFNYKHLGVNYNSFSPYIINTHEYYVEVSTPIAKSFKLNVAGHFLWTLQDKSFDYHYDSLNNVLSLDENRETAIMNHELISAQLFYYYRNLALDFTFTYNGLSQSHVTYNSLGLNWYPLGNFDLYSASRLFYIVQLESENNFAFKQSVGGKVFPKLWLELSYVGKGMYGYTEGNGFIIYSPTSKLIDKYEISGLYLLSDKLQLSLRYQYITNTNSVGYYDDPYYSEYKLTEKEFTNNAFLAGLKWSF